MTKGSLSPPLFVYVVLKYQCGRCMRMILKVKKAVLRRPCLYRWLRLPMNWVWSTYYVYYKYIKKAVDLYCFALICFVQCFPSVVYVPSRQPALFYTMTASGQGEKEWHSWKWTFSTFGKNSHLRDSLKKAFGF